MKHRRKTYKFQTTKQFFEQLNPPPTLIYLGRNDIGNDSVGALFRHKDKIVRVYHSEKWNAGVVEKNNEGEYKCVLMNKKYAKYINEFLEKTYTNV